MLEHRVPIEILRKNKYHFVSQIIRLEQEKGNYQPQHFCPKYHLWEGLKR
jgi:hypothetical protein